MIDPIDLHLPSSVPHSKTFVSYKSEYAATRLKVVKFQNAVFFTMRSSNLTGIPFGQASIQSVGAYNLFRALRV
jgi:sulfur transfer complex TusBCD TusB component (DsrH family)